MFQAWLLAWFTVLALLLGAAIVFAGFVVGEWLPFLDLFEYWTDRKADWFLRPSPWKLVFQGVTLLFLILWVVIGLSPFYGGARPLSYVLFFEKDAPAPDPHPPVAPAPTEKHHKRIGKRPAKQGSTVQAQ